MSFPSLATVYTVAALASAPIAVADAGESITVVSLNAWGLPAPLAPDRGGRLRAAGAWIAGMGADVVGLQEIWDGAAPLLPLDVERSGGGDDGLALHTRHAWSDVDVRRFTAGRGWDRLKRKGVLRGRLHRAEGPDVWVYVTHMQAGYGRANAGVRERQLDELLAWVDATPGPVIVLGDFNVDEHDPADAGFLARAADAGLVDVAGSLGVVDGTYPGDGRRYDRVFVRHGGGWRLVPSTAQVVRYEGDLPVLSDHLPLVCTLAIEPEDAVAEGR